MTRVCMMGVAKRTVAKKLVRCLEHRMTPPVIPKLDYASREADLCHRMLCVLAMLSYPDSTVVNSCTIGLIFLRTRCEPPRPKELRAVGCFEGI
jgi:hypothetical protein